MKLLLTSVFGPYAVDDEFGRKENVMELFHNQVTREQGIFSLRMNHESFGLHLIAENINVPTTILDFPSKNAFIKEIRKGYDYIGISFIVPNFIKAEHMANLIRQYSPNTKIILGGHGTNIENIEKLIPCDHVCKGEGVAFMRKLFNNDVDAPIKHPMLFSSFNKHVIGAPGKKDSGVIVPGVGCVNACRFCCTTHFFDKVYTPFIKTGQEMFDLCLKMEETMGVKEFFIMDENFLKFEERARELLALMEKHGKTYSFGIFSSAETITKVGIDFIQRLGVNFLWMGVESKREIYEKNKGVDFKSLIKELRDNGIVVLASGILFLEYHTKETIHEDIDFMVDLNADLVQFMQLGPLPGTKLYNDYNKEGKLLKDIPYEEWHGQHQLWFNHPHFTKEESAYYLKQAFLKDYKVNGPSISRITDTVIRGVINTRKGSTTFEKKRHERRALRGIEFYPLIDALCVHAPNKRANALAVDIRKRYDSFFGKRSLELKAKSFAVQGLIISEKIRSRLVRNNMRQPKTLYSNYRTILGDLHGASFVGKEGHSDEANILKVKMVFNQPQVCFMLSGILDTKNIKEMQSSIVKFFKNDERFIILNLSKLHYIEEEALRKFFKNIERYKHLIQIYTTKTSKCLSGTSAMIESLANEFNINMVTV